MKYLALNHYRVVAMRDLHKYVDPSLSPDDPLEIINRRRSQLEE